MVEGLSIILELLTNQKFGNRQIHWICQSLSLTTTTMHNTCFIFVGYLLQDASFNISDAEFCIRCLFLTSSSMSGCGIRFYDTSGPLNRQLIMETSAMQVTHADAAVTCVDLAKVENSTYLEIYDIGKDGKFSEHPAKTFNLNSTSCELKLFLVH